MSWDQVANRIPLLPFYCTLAHLLGTMGWDREANRIPLLPLYCTLAQLLGTMGWDMLGKTEFHFLHSTVHKLTF
jgi:hypothetical protein